MMFDLDILGKKNKQKKHSTKRPRPFNSTITRNPNEGHVTNLVIPHDWRKKCQNDGIWCQMFIAKIVENGLYVSELFPKATKPTISSREEEDIKDQCKDNATLCKQMKEEAAKKSFIRSLFDQVRNNNDDNSRLWWLLMLLVPVMFIVLALLIYWLYFKNKEIHVKKNASNLSKSPTKSKKKSISSSKSKSPIKSKSRISTKSKRSPTKNKSKSSMVRRSKTKGADSKQVNMVRSVKIQS